MRSILATIVAILLCCATSRAQTSQPAWQSAFGGELILRPFQNAPYPHPSREKGFQGSHQFYPKDPHYTDSTVAIFIPPDFKSTDAVNYVVHFHGHNNHVAKVLPQYKLLESFAGSKVNAILVVPQGPKDAADSGGGKLELDRNGFERLITEITEFLNAEHKLQTKRIGTIVLSTHSGGYKVTAAILDHGGLAEHITDVLLLDSSYGSLPWFADWVKASPSHRLVSLYTQHLADENKELRGLLDTAGVKYQQFDEATVTDAQLRSRGAMFMPVKGPHDEVPVQYFQRLLETSALKPGR
jgi:hypothetical protein